MAMIKLLRKKIDSNQFEFTKHALDQTILRRITIEEVREAITDGEVIEDYPDDKYGPSCLVFGRKKIRQTHTSAMQPPVACNNKDYHYYQPDPEQWIDYKARR